MLRAPWTWSLLPVWCQWAWRNLSHGQLSHLGFLAQSLPIEHALPEAAEQSLFFKEGKLVVLRHFEVTKLRMHSLEDRGDRKKALNSVRLKPTTSWLRCVRSTALLHLQPVWSSWLLASVYFILRQTKTQTCSILNIPSVAELPGHWVQSRTPQQHKCKMWGSPVWVILPCHRASQSFS